MLRCGNYGEHFVENGSINVRSMPLNLFAVTLRLISRGKVLIYKQLVSQLVEAFANFMEIFLHPFSEEIAIVLYSEPVESVSYVFIINKHR
jgi:hypothetical protein